MTEPVEPCKHGELADAAEQVGQLKLAEHLKLAQHLGQRHVLALDTSSDAIALAVGALPPSAEQQIELLATGDLLARREANVRLVPAIEKLFTEHGLDKARLTSVVCGRGPGSFTGVRIAVATAKGLAAGLGVPLHGVATPDAVAWQAWLGGVRGQLAVLSDAMRGEVYPARYGLDEQGAHREGPLTVIKAELLRKNWEGYEGSLVLTGDALYKYGELFSAYAWLSEDYWRVKGEGLLRAFAAEPRDSGSIEALLPVYTRLSDAEENERRRLAAGGAITQGALTEVPASGVAWPAQTGQTVFRPAAASDIAALVALEQSVYPHPGSILSGECWTEPLYKASIGQADTSWWVCYRGDNLVGFAGGQMLDGQMHVLDVVVGEAYRRQGIARHLLLCLMQDAQDLGATELTLEVRAGNVAAQALYARLALAPTGRRKGYYRPLREGEPREDALILTGSLASCIAACATAGRTDYNAKSVHAFSEESSQSPLESETTQQGEGCLEAEDSQEDQDFQQGESYQPAHPLILALESSCDETAAALIDGEGRLLTNVVASQTSFHARFGGVVPEIASRKHTEALYPVAREALAGRSWQDLDAIAVTYAPGLIGALVVGLAFAKGLCWATGLPLIKVNHLEGHIYANRFVRCGGDKGEAEASDATRAETPDATPVEAPDAASTVAAGVPKAPEATHEAGSPGCSAEGCSYQVDARFLRPPFIIALLSGGNTLLVHVLAWGRYEVLGQTLDDAVGEAYDKVAKALGLGYPGGPVIARLASEGNAKAINFPRALLHSGDYQFSLSGLKTAVLTVIREQHAAGTLHLPDIAASFEQAVIEVQVAKALRACESLGVDTFCLGGGVAANRALREAYKAAMEPRGIRVVFPPELACTDNAAMIAAVALDRYKQGRFASLSDDAAANADLELPY
ncbi:MAG: tRNA (adenosine(37)-N6)-threonylcarbamoyltransferase complex dimerization subunit type 1 TsaB [Coriobacteriales bacterium]|jgi:N6-L-threonylcarbamoyladenine synthase|nr:tRNA (adenosine(37)-N6)-threonylcarbamoyltransferase complex dimerization subunit type 1 TsaB [Coriobacteriales bacterium]